MERDWKAVEVFAVELYHMKWKENVVLVEGAVYIPSGQTPLKVVFCVNNYVELIKTPNSNCA